MNPMYKLVPLLFVFLSACSGDDKSSESTQTKKIDIDKHFQSYAQECSSKFEQTTKTVQEMQPQDAKDFIFPESLQEAFYNNAISCLNEIEKFVVGTEHAFSSADKGSTCLTTVASNKATLEKAKVDLSTFASKPLESISDRLHAFKGVKDFSTEINTLKNAVEATYKTACSK